MTDLLTELEAKAKAASEAHVSPSYGDTQKEMARQEKFYNYNKAANPEAILRLVAAYRELDITMQDYASGVMGYEYQTDSAKEALASAKAILENHSSPK